MKNDILYIWLQQAIGLCNRIALEIMPRFSDISDIYSCEDFSFLGEKREQYITRLLNKDTSSAFEALKRIRSLGAEVTGYYDTRFPDKLRLIAAPPVVLYSIGTWRDLNTVPCVAVVGTRKMSDYGKEIAEKFAYVIAKSGAYVVSGLAKGVDTAAHRGAVMAGGYTVAVLGNPIGEVYPRENEKAFASLYKCGLVISEMYPGCPRTKADFPNRNRIISGLSAATVVAEAGEGSGALITARCALEQGRLVFAVPGDIGAENAGTNQLIKSGVPVATEPYDIIAPLALEYPESVKPYQPSLTAGLRSYGNAGAAKKRANNPAPGVSAPEPPKEPVEPDPLEAFAEPVKKVPGGIQEQITELLRASRPLTGDEISRQLGCDITKVLSELTVMEITGAVVKTAGGRFAAND